MKHRRKKNELIESQQLHTKMMKKGGRGERTNASDINIMWVVFSQQFSDRWLGALLCIFADIWFAYWQQLSERAATRLVCSSITSPEYATNISSRVAATACVGYFSYLTIWVGGIHASLFFFHSFVRFWLEAFPISSLVDFHHLHVIMLMYWRTNSRLSAIKRMGPHFAVVVVIRTTISLQPVVLAAQRREWTWDLCRCEFKKKKNCGIQMPALCAVWHLWSCMACRFICTLWNFRKPYSAKAGKRISKRDKLHTSSSLTHTFLFSRCRVRLLNE